MFRELIVDISSNLMRRSGEVVDISAGKLLAEKAYSFDTHIRPMFEDLTLYQTLLVQVNPNVNDLT